MPKLVCIVEGQGEVEAIPDLCSRIREYVEAWQWHVDPDPIRMSRGLLVEAAIGSNKGLAKEKETGLPRAIELARRRPGSSAVLVVCDEDDDCAAIWAPSAAALVARVSPGNAVMAVREYETWLAYNASDAELQQIGVPDPEARRDGKGILRRLIPGYKPTTHQLSETRRIDIARVRTRSDSFDKLVRVLGSLFGGNVPERPAR